MPKKVIKCPCFFTLHKTQHILFLTKKLVAQTKKPTRFNQRHHFSFSPPRHLWLSLSLSQLVWFLVRLVFLINSVFYIVYGKTHLNQAFSIALSCSFSHQKGTRDLNLWRAKDLYGCRRPSRECPWKFCWKLKNGLQVCGFCRLIHWRYKDN